MTAAPIGRVLGLTRPARGRLVLATFLGACAAGSAIALLATSAWLISRAAQHPSVVALGVAIVGVQFFSISRALFRYKERLVGHDAALRVMADTRAGVYEHLEVLAPTGLSNFRSGDLMARFVGDVDSISDLMLRVVPPYGIVLVVGAPTVGFIWYFLPAAAIVVAVALAVGAFLVPWYALGLARRRESRQAAAKGELSTYTVDLLQGAPELVAYGATDAQLERIAAADTELTRIATAASRTAGVASGLTTLLTGLAVWGALLVAVPAVHSGRLEGPLLAVMALVPLAAFEMVTGLPVAAQYLQRVRESAARVFAVMGEPAPVVEPEVAKPMASGPPVISLTGVRARYGPERRWALDGVDLDLWPGRRVGVVGPSGAGKSTLAAVLLRFLPYEGSVTLDGTELDRLSGEDVRRVVGLAAQDAHIFDTTLRENLLLANRQASPEAVASAVERAQLLDWVEALPAGLDTSVGEHGARMSGGQRQRVGVARTFLAGFPVLVLDEPDEHLDAATAEALTLDLVDATRGQTTVMITHRLAALEAMDEIIVLDAGRVVQRGTHAQLITVDGPYARQWERECGAAFSSETGTERVDLPC
ncbi:MAG TPA: thiol reductant ABC exporter subunit CydC [Acidimicrobiales bacterium]|nr:thiol reductant ABC exporter subunit CydC [Acidimicrobiales bacterium]